jgi:hypothetical protein
MATKHSTKRPHYCPIGSAGNGKPNRYEVGINDCDMYDDEEFEFLKAMDAYKTANDRPFPTWTEVLQVLKSLGYRKETTHGEQRQMETGWNGRQAAERIEACKNHALPAVCRAEKYGPHRLCG